MSPRPLGMDPVRVDDVSVRLMNLREALRATAEEADVLVAASLNPVTYGVQPGGLILAPAAIAATLYAASSLKSAASSVQTLALRLRAEADSQRDASGVDAGQDGAMTEPRKVALPEDRSPESISEWWRDLPEPEKQRLIRQNPDLLRNLDGIPFTVRDQLNRRELNRVLADPDATPERRAQAERILVALDESQRRFPKEPIQLLLLDWESEPGFPVVAVSIGNLDVADNVQTVVPGMDSNVDAIGSGLDAAGQVYRSTSDALAASGQSGTNATVFWLGYRTPGMTEVTEDSLAEEGASRFERFDRGLDAVNPGSRQTIVAHSYGSRTVSIALTRAADANALVMLGSPGIGKGIVSAGQMNIDDGEVYATRAEEDDVSDEIYKLAENPWMVISPFVGILDAADSSDVNPDPTEDVAGVKVFTSHNGARHDLLRGDGQGYLGSPDSAYRQVGLIAVGRGGAL